MALDGGNVDPNTGGGTGLAKAIFDALNAEYGPFAQRDLASVAPFCTRLGTAIVDYFKTNTDVTVTIPNTLGALQQVAGVDTDPPSAPRDIEGSIA